MTVKTLTTAPAVPVWIEGEFVVFDRKFYDGMLLYVKEWQGKIKCIMSQGNQAPPPFGVIKKTKEELPFELVVLSQGETITSDHLQGASVVLAAGDSFDKFHVSKLCKSLNIKCVYVIEYIPETRHQILDLEKINPIVKLRRKIFLWSGEKKRLAAFAEADGIQANGMPAYNAYKKFKNCILYFDTRINIKDIISEEKLTERLNQLEKSKTIRLAFSGRLIRMKGADHLVKLANLLKQRNVDFKMTIYGAGDLEDEMADEISKLGLSNEVNMPGAVDFYNELLPDIKENIDLYVVLHRQSDPSCTYLETLSCGIPIVGYENKAFLGLLEQQDIGWGQPMNDLEGIANTIQNLSNNKKDIKEKSIRSVNFSRAHDFENTFKKRIKHLYDLAE